MLALTLAAALSLFGGPAVSQGDPADCAPWQTCRELALAAAERGEFETFHTIAWRAVQTGPRNDPELMYLLARAQSLSGRPNDALVMLRRLADRGIARLEAETLEDFRRVRNLPDWPAALEALRQVSTGTAPVLGATPAASSKAVPLRPTARAARARLYAPLRPSMSSAPASGSTDGASRAFPGVTANPAEGRPVPEALGTPVAMAYDAVSARLVIADEASDTLKIFSEVSGTATDLVSRGWADPYRTTAIAIDGRRGDLWVAGVDASGGKSESVLQRVQLISGRLRYRVSLPADAGAARFAAVALSAANAFVLDVEGRRIFEVEQGGKTLQLRMAIHVDEPAGLAVARDDLAFVSHAGGLLRLDLDARRSAALTVAKRVDVRGLQWIEYDAGSLLGIQRRADGTLAAVRIRLDSAARRATSLEVLGPAASRAATVMNGVFYYLENRPGGQVMRSISVR